MDTGKPNKPRETTAGFIAALLTATWFFNLIAHGADWIGRGQTLIALDPYIHYVVTPWALLVQFVGAVGLLFYATRLEHFREADEAPRIIIDLSARQRQKPKKHWLWIKVGIGSVFVSVLAYAALVGILHYRSRTQNRRATIAKSAPAQAPVLGQSANEMITPSTGSQNAKKHPARQPTQALPKSDSDAVNQPVPSSSIPATPIPGKSLRSPASPELASPYDELKDVEEKVAALNDEWQQDIQTVGQDFARPYKMPNSGPSPNQLPIQLLGRLYDDEKNVTNTYEKLEPQIKEARADAIAHMPLTPNQKLDDEQFFIQANKQALSQATLESLQKFPPYQDQFISIKNYLAKLLRQLGDY